MSFQLNTMSFSCNLIENDRCQFSVYFVIPDDFGQSKRCGSSVKQLWFVASKRACVVQHLLKLVSENFSIINYEKLGTEAETDNFSNALRRNKKRRPTLPSKLLQQLTNEVFSWFKDIEQSLVLWIYVGVLETLHMSKPQTSKLLNTQGMNCDQRSTIPSDFVTSKVINTTQLCQVTLA